MTVYLHCYKQYLSFHNHIPAYQIHLEYYKFLTDYSSDSSDYNYSGDPNVWGGWNLQLSYAGNAVYIQTYTGTNIRIKNAQPSHTVVFLALSLSVTFFFLLSRHKFLLDLNSRCYVIHILAVASSWNLLILLSYIM